MSGCVLVRREATQCNARNRRATLAALPYRQCVDGNIGCEATGTIKNGLLVVTYAWERPPWATKVNDRVHAS
jgi:hypothetical protein